MELKDYLRILQRRWIVILSVFLVGCAAAYYLTEIRKTTFYYARATVLFRPSPYELAFVVPEEQAFQVTLLKDRLTVMTGDVVLGRVAERLQKDFKEPISPAELQQYYAVAMGQQEHTVVVTATHPRIPSKDPKTPDFQVLLADLLIEEYSAHDRTQSALAVRAARKALQEELGKIEGDLQSSRDRLLTRLKKDLNESGIADPEIQANIKSQVLAEIEKRRQDNRFELLRIEDGLRRIPREEREIAEDDMLRAHFGHALSGGGNGASAREMEGRLKEIQGRLVDLRRKYHEVHPDIVGLKEAILRLQDDISLELRRPRIDETTAFLDKKTLLEANEEFLQGVLAYEYESLFGLARNKDTYQDMRRELTRLEDRRVKVAEEQSKVDRIEKQTEARSLQAMERISRTSRALPVAAPGRVSMTAYIVMIAIFSAVSGFLLEYLNTTVRTEQDVRRYLNLSLLGVVPMVRKGEEVLLHKVAPKTPLEEVFNTICALVESQAAETSSKVFMVASSNPEEGKSTVSANLAASLARAGSRVLLLDCDLRKAVQHRFFGVANETGLAAYLGGGLETIDPAILPTAVERLSLIPAGEHPDNPVQLLRSDRFKALLADLRIRYDYVVVDVPPCRVAVDSLVLSSLVDSTILLVAAETTRKDDASNAKRLITSARGKLMGCVLNKATAPTGGYYYYYDRYYYYSNYGYGYGHKKHDREIRRM